MALAARGAYARLYAGVFGAVYGLVTIIGFIQPTTMLGLIHVNLADNILHLQSAAASLIVYFISSNMTVSASRGRPRSVFVVHR